MLAGRSNSGSKGRVPGTCLPGDSQDRFPCFPVGGTAFGYCFQILLHGDRSFLFEAKMVRHRPCQIEDIQIHGVRLGHTCPKSEYV